MINLPVSLPLAGRTEYSGGSYKNVRIRLVVGYHITSDSYITHVFVTPDGYPERKLFTSDAGVFSSEKEAIEKSLAETEMRIGSGSY